MAWPMTTQKSVASKVGVKAKWIHDCQGKHTSELAFELLLLKKSQKIEIRRS